MTLPGMGDRGKKCGEWYPREFCWECGEPHVGQNRCMNRDCPECWRPWRQDRVFGITRRLSALRQAGDGIERRAMHTVFSPPEGEITTLREASDGFRDAYALAKEKGVRGGVAVFHGFRVTDAAKAEWGQETNGGADGPKLWAWVREHERDWRELTYWSPHYHVLGVCEDFEEDDPDAQDGWVARRIRSLNEHRLTDPDGYEDITGTAFYLLSHASYESGTSKDCVRWFGEASTATFQPESALSPGTLATVERYAEEACEAPVTDGEDGEGDGPDDQKELCERCGANALQPIWDAGMRLQDRAWCEQIGPEAQQRLQAAFEWAIGEALPPPGLRRPDSEEEAKEALAELV